MEKAAAHGTADYAAAGKRDPSPKTRGLKLKDFLKSSKADGDARKAETGQPIPPPKPDKKPPGPHRMGAMAWKMERRKLDALFAIYVMGWETTVNKHSKWRPYIRPLGNDEWEYDMLRYFHDSLSYCMKGVELLRKKKKYIIIGSTEKGYEVQCGTITVQNTDLNFAVMAVCLLACGIDQKVIQNCWDNQDDFSRRAARRCKEK